MLSVTELRNGTVYEDSGTLYQVLSYEHIKMGRGSATIKLKIRNLRNGSTTEKSFINNAKVNDVQVVKKDLQFLYKDDPSARASTELSRMSSGQEFAYFMDTKSFEQIQVPLKKIHDEHQYLKEGETFTVSFFEDEPLSLNLPPKMEFEVTETGPDLRGNSATNIYKDAVLQNNIKTKVPLFVKTGDRIRIDTRTGAYSEKA